MRPFFGIRNDLWQSQSATHNDPRPRTWLYHVISCLSPTVPHLVYPLPQSFPCTRKVGRADLALNKVSDLDGKMAQLV